MTLRLLTVALSDVGRVRAGNEDAYLLDPDSGMFAVADGMGGHQAGEVASSTAIAALRDAAPDGDSIADAIVQANAAVFDKAATDLALRGMGTTLTAAVLGDDGALVLGHVGDSRAYQLRDGELRQLTSDHSVVAELIAAGELTEAEAEIDPRRAMITRALGIEFDVVVDVFPVVLERGDRLLLCSDGLTTMVRDAAIAAVLRDEPDRSHAARALVDAANDAGGADNITVVVGDVVDDMLDSLPDAPAPAAPPDPPDEPIVEPHQAAEAPDDAGDHPAPKRHWWQRRREGK